MAEPEEENKDQVIRAEEEKLEAYKAQLETLKEIHQIEGDLNESQSNRLVIAQGSLDDVEQRLQRLKDEKADRKELLDLEKEQGRVTSAQINKEMVARDKTIKFLKDQRPIFKL